MKHLFVLVLVVCLLCLLGCAGISSDSSFPMASSSRTSGLGAPRPVTLPSPSTNPPPSQQPPPPPPPPPPPTTYDILSWMTMSPDLAADHHMAGSANPVYTNLFTDKFYWTKTGSGYPWDIQLYDDKYIYLWVTELDWHNPRSFKMFNSPSLGYYNMPFAPRTTQGGFPGSSIQVEDTTYEIHTDCDTYTTKTLGHAVNEIWGPYSESLGGDLPNNLQTLVISYQYSCDGNYGNCKDKEEFHIAQPYGLVKWQHLPLQSDGNYGPPDNVTILNKLVTGQVQPSTVCF